MSQEETIAREFYIRMGSEMLTHGFPVDDTTWDELDPVIRHIYLHTVENLLDRGIIARPRLPRMSTTGSRGAG